MFGHDKAREVISQMQSEFDNNEDNKEVSIEESNGLEKGNSEVVRIALIGDSTIDNIIWTHSLETCVGYQLQKSLENVGVRPCISNFACDGKK
jgi:hypothetical protein